MIIPFDDDYRKLPLDGVFSFAHPNKNISLRTYTTYINGTYIYVGAYTSTYVHCINVADTEVNNYKYILVYAWCVRILVST